MSFVYVCEDCQRVASSEDITKVGVANKMFKQVYMAPLSEAGVSAGAYSKNPTIICPYCYGKMHLGTEADRLGSLFKKRKYPQIDDFKYNYLQTTQKFADCYVNVYAGERELRGLSGEATEKVTPILEACGWKIDHEVIKSMDDVFPRPEICYYEAEKTYYIYKDHQIIMKVRENSDGSYDLADGEGDFRDLESLRGAKGWELLGLANQVIADYSLMIRA